MRTLDLIDAGPSDDAPRPGADRAQVAVGVVTAVAAGGRMVTVSVLGSAPVSLPAATSTWTGVTTCNVLMDATTGRPVFVLGPAPAPTQPVVSEALDAGFEELDVERATVLTPTWSGTHRQGRGWDQWNTGRFGGRTDLYQGTQGDSGRLAGIATYGDHMAALGAATVTAATLTLTGNDPRQPAFTALVQAAERTDTGPAPTGPTVSATVTGAETTTVDITALAGGLMAGLGLALVGGQYGAVRGDGASMTVGLTYTTTEEQP